MAKRPWITPQNVRDYTERENVKNRSDVKLEIDISRAEWYVIKYTNNDFSDDSRYPELPEPVKTAVLLVAESYAADSAGFSEDRGTYKSETFDDYSYTLADTSQKIGNLDLDPLLSPFVESGAKGELTLRMRKL